MVSFYFTMSVRQSPMNLLQFITVLLLSYLQVGYSRLRNRKLIVDEREVRKPKLIVEALAIEEEYDAAPATKDFLDEYDRPRKRKYGAAAAEP